MSEDSFLVVDFLLETGQEVRLTREMLQVAMCDGGFCLRYRGRDSHVLAIREIDPTRNKGNRWAISVKLDPHFEDN